MKTNKQQLLKHFASVLRDRANGKNDPISSTLLKHLSRKDLVEVIKKVNNGTVPKQLDLALMENQELLEVIKDEMYIIAYITEKWSKEEPLKVVPTQQESSVKAEDKSKITTSNTAKKDKK